MAISAKRYAPYTEVEFHTKTKLYSISKGGWNSTQPTRDLVSVQTTKQLSAPIGTWQIVLTAARGEDGMDWYDRLTSNDLVVIKMGRPPELIGTPMVGLIDEVRRTRAIGVDGEPEMRIMVRGSDFGKVLSRAMLRFYPSLANSDVIAQDEHYFATSSGWQAMLNFFVGSDLIQGTPPDMMRQAMVKILFRLMNVSYKYWDKSAGERDAHLANILRFRFAETDRLIPFLLTMLDYEGAFWNFIERISAKPFNELFVDTRGVQPDENVAGKTPELLSMVPNPVAVSNYPAGDPLAKFMQDSNITTNPNWSATFGEDGSKVMLYLRNTPFDAKDWENLYTHDYDYGDLTSEDLGRSDSENYNVFMVTNSLSVPSSTNLKLLVHPVMDEVNAFHYGMNPLEVTLEGISIEDDKIDSGIEASIALSKKLYDWYHLNKDYKNGTVSVRGNAFIKIGQRLRIRNCEYNYMTKKFDDLVFYIEGVQQDFSMMDAWTTNVTLTRGQREKTPAPPKSTTGATPKDAKPTPPTPGQTASTPTAKSHKTYTVKTGDTLWTIAAKPDVYGSGDQWRKIWNANSDALIARDSRNKQNPGAYLYAGQVLVIPE
jgi:hypothetical protein